MCTRHFLFLELSFHGAPNDHTTFNVLIFLPAAAKPVICLQDVLSLISPPPHRKQSLSRQSKTTASKGISATHTKSDRENGRQIFESSSKSSYSCSSNSSNHELFLLGCAQKYEVILRGRGSAEICGKSWDVP